MKRTQTIVPSRGIMSIKSNTQKDIRSFVIVKASQFAQLCVVATTRHSRTNDLTTSKALSRAIK